MSEALRTNQKKWKQSCFEMVWYGFFRRNEKGRIAREQLYIFDSMPSKGCSANCLSHPRPADGYVATK